MVVDVGTVLGFLTRSPSEAVPKSNVMFLLSRNLTGYSKSILSAATIFNTVVQTLASSGITPLITPIFAGISFMFRIIFIILSYVEKYTPNGELNPNYL